MHQRLLTELPKPLTRNLKGRIDPHRNLRLHIIKRQHLRSFRGKPRVNVTGQHNHPPTVNPQIRVIRETDSIIETVKRRQRAQRFKLTI
jgi:hypothetical protein